MKRKKLAFLGEFTEEEKKKLDIMEDVFGIDEEEIEEINKEYLKSAENED